MARYSIFQATARIVRRLIPCGLTLGYLFFILLPASSRAQDEQPRRKLEPGQPLERSLHGGAAHTYVITLSAGQFLHVVVEQRKIDVVVRVAEPDGKLLVEMDSPNEDAGPEPVLLVAEASGDYRLEVRSASKDAQAGHYEVKISVRAATEQEHAWAAAFERFSAALGLNYQEKYDEASRLFGQAAERYTRTPGAPPAEIVAAFHYLGTTLDDLARRYRERGQYAQVAPLCRQILNIRAHTLGPAHSDVAAAHNNLAAAHFGLGEYAPAKEHYQRALLLWEQALGSAHLNVATACHNLARVYLEEEDYAEAERLCRRALAIREQALDKNPADVETSNDLAATLNDLAGVHYQRGDCAQARPLYERALGMLERTLGAEHRYLAAPLAGLAGIHRAQRNYAQAEAGYGRALAILEKALGRDHPGLITLLNNAGGIYRHRGDDQRAEDFYQRALAISDRALGPERPAVTATLNNLAVLYYARGDYAQAEPLYRRALAISERAFGPEHPDVALWLYNLALLAEATGARQQAITLLTRSAEIRERKFSRHLLAGSERQKLAYLDLFAVETDYTLSLHLRFAPDDPQARDLALTTLLRRKGRALEAMTDTLGQLRRHAAPADQAMFDELAAARARLAALLLRAGDPAAYRAQLAPLEAEVDRLEGQLSARSAEFRAQAQPVTPKLVQAALPRDAALVEFARYAPHEPRARRPGPARYAAYVLAAEGAARAVDLGAAAAIERAVTELRRALCERRPDVKQRARAVEQLVMRPVRALLGRARHVLLAPDGALNLVPFAALVDEQNRYLVTHYSFSYLTSGRDVLRWPAPRPSRSKALIVANPAFDHPISAAPRAIENPQITRAGGGQPCAQVSALGEWEELAGTAAEAAALKTILPEATVLTGTRATEAALKRVSGPRILHVATHGFFSGSARELGQATACDLADAPSHSARASGLALAGANQRRSDPESEDDGVLTTLEAAGLDLWGTRLVVLSACETGVGEVKNGEGVYGLRRALILAGAESQVVSLWRVSDAATRRLMIAYYRALQQGRGRGAALRDVQLRLLASREHQHPYFWASFIQVGEWANLAGRR